MTEPRAWDTVLVVHRRTEPAAMVAACPPGKPSRILVLSTHHPFPPERTALAAALAPATVEFLSFAALFDDAALAAIDAATTTELRTANVPPDDFIDAYETRMIELRNAAAATHLAARGRWRKIYVDHGLGVAADGWIRAGASPLGPPRLRETVRASSLRRWLATARDRWFPRRCPVTVLQDGADRYLFVTGVRRLPLKPGTLQPVVPWRRGDESGPNTFAATALHDYDPLIRQLKLPIRIFVDSYLPSNYPRSYLDGYAEADFVCPDPFSARWLRRQHRTVLRPPSFLATRPLAPPRPPARINTVVLLLNHAGDWTALIHRSDTDILVEVLAELARTFPAQRFIVRCHPGMNLPRHEGPGAAARIAGFVTDCRLTNLQLSTGSLAEDLAQGDLFLSEYSATLIEAWSVGRLGLAVNLTHRRSFMQDFADLGFGQVSSIDELKSALGGIIADPAPLVTAQDAAVHRYNEELTKYLTE